MAWKNGQAHSLEEAAERATMALLLKWYKRGYREGYRAAKQEERPELHYCRECKWLNGDKRSIGIRCTCPNRRRGSWASTANYKAPTAKACKTGFEPKEADNDTTGKN